MAGLLQQIAERKPEVAGPIAEVVGQVQAIAQVYGLQVGAAGPLRIVDVVGRSPTRCSARSVEPSGSPSSRATAAAEWMLPEAEAIPIALTLNELLTNAIKHSAGAGEPGSEVGCRLECTATDVHVGSRMRPTAAGLRA